MSTWAAMYVAQHGTYIRSAEFSARWHEWRDTKGNKGPFLLTIGQAHLFVTIAGFPPLVPIVLVVALWARWWFSRRPRAAWWRRAWWKPLPPVCRAHSWPSFRGRLAKVQYHHLSYRALDAVIDAGGEMRNPADRARVAALEKNQDAMALCRRDHKAVEWLLELVAGATGKSKRRLRRTVSWGEVLLVRTFPVLVLAFIWRGIFEILR
jgi:hypothetical protein